jgi:hypothetical protein
VEINLKEFGPNHPGTLSKHTLAMFYSKAGRHVEATALVDSIIKERTSVLAIDHPDTLGNRNLLATNHLETHNEAVDIFESIVPRYE